jgi:hypothetical protein
MFNKTPHQPEWIDKLIEASVDAVKGYEDYLLDKIKYNDLAKIMKKLHNAIPDENQQPQKAKRIDPKDYKHYFD